MINCEDCETDVIAELYGTQEIIQWQDTGECPEADALFDKLYFDYENNVVDCEQDLLGGEQRQCIEARTAWEGAWNECY